MSMTKEEAAQLLSVPVDVGPDDVRRRYQELHNEYQVRLTNAPTPALKKVYQRNLQELQEASRVLAPGFEIAGPADLPAPEPIRGDDPGAGPRATPRVDPAARPGPGPSRAPTDAGLPKSTKLAIVGAAVCAAAASLFAILWSNTAGGWEEDRRAMASMSAELEQLRAASGEIDRIMKVAPLTICNKSSNALTVLSAVSMYVTPAGRIRTVYSGNYDWPTWTIRPGERRTLNIVRGLESDWDGSAAVYSLLIDYPGREAFSRVGLMSDVKGGCLEIRIND